MCIYIYILHSLHCVLFWIQRGNHRSGQSPMHNCSYIILCVLVTASFCSCLFEDRLKHNDNNNNDNNNNNKTTTNNS